MKLTYRFFVSLGPLTLPYTKVELWSDRLRIVPWKTLRFLRAVEWPLHAISSARVGWGYTRLQAGRTRLTLASFSENEDFALELARRGVAVQGVNNY